MKMTTIKLVKSIGKSSVFSAAGDTKGIPDLEIALSPFLLNADFLVIEQYDLTRSIAYQ